MCGCVESVFNKVTNLVTDKVVGAIDPKNVTIKSLQETANKGRMYAVLIMIASIVTAIFGGLLCSGLGAILGVPILLVSVASFYGAYNAYRVCTNLKDHAADCVAIVKASQNNYQGIKKAEGDQKANNNDELTLLGRLANLFGNGKEADKLNAQQLAQRTHDADVALKTIIKKDTVFFDVFGDSISEALLKKDSDEGIAIVNQQ